MSTILPSDIFLANKDTLSHRVLSGNLMDIDESILLVNRDGVSYKCPNTQLPDKLRDSDIMLINRGGTSYKVTGADVKSILTPLITNLDWSIPADSTQLYPQSMPLSESILIDKDPTTAIALEAISGDGPRLNVSFTSLPEKYTIKKIIYDPHDRDIAGGGWGNSVYSIDEIIFTCEPNGGTNQYRRAITQKDFDETKEIVLPESFDAIQVNGIKSITFKNTNASSLGFMAVGGLRIYGEQI